MCLGMLNGDLRKLEVSLVHFPRFHFFLCSFAPSTADSNVSHARLSVKELTARAVSARNFYCSAVNKLNPKDVDFVMQNLQQDEAKQPTRFVDWIPNNIKSGICKLAGEEVMSATKIANSTALKGIFQRLATQFGNSAFFS